MQTIDAMVEEIDKKGIKIEYVGNKHLNTCKALTMEIEEQYYILLNIENIKTEAEERCILAHEWGHCLKCAVHNISTTKETIRKNEYKADKVAVMELIPKKELDEAIRNGYTEVWQLAEHIGVTEDFIKQAFYIYDCMKIPVNSGEKGDDTY